MLLTITLLVLGSAILAFFASEFSGFAKKILKLPGMMLILPLLGASYLVVSFEDFILWVLMGYQKILKALSASVADLLSSLPINNELAVIMVIMMSSIVPLLIYSHYHERKTYRPYAYVILVSGCLWFLSTALLILPIL
jgi:hypothetical protein